MKKTASFLILSLVTMGCNNQEKAINSGYNDCNRTIVIDQSKVDEKWEAENRIYYSNPQPNITNSCTHSKIFIDATELEKAQIFADWLKKNGKYICFKETSSYIECEHLITNEEDIETLKKTTTFDTQTFEEIEKKIISMNGNFNSYTKYIKFYKNSSSKLEIKLECPFNSSANYYSTPLIKSIKDNNNLTTTAKFIFKEIDKYIYFGVEISPGNYNYYNFSHIPPLIGKPVTSPI